MISIYDLEKQATPGPIEVRYPQDNTCLVRVVRSDMQCIAECANAADAALLTHCRNHFMESLEALKETHQRWVDDWYDRTGGGHFECDMCKIIKELEEVK